MGQQAPPARFARLKAAPAGAPIRSWCVARVVPGLPDTAVRPYGVLTEEAASLIAGAFRDSSPEAELEQGVNYLPRLRSQVSGWVALSDVRPD